MASSMPASSSTIAARRSAAPGSAYWNSKLRGSRVERIGTDRFLLISSSLHRLHQSDDALRQHTPGPNHGSRLTLFRASVSLGAIPDRPTRRGDLPRASSGPPRKYARFERQRPVVQGIEPVPLVRADRGGAGVAVRHD